MKTRRRQRAGTRLVKQRTHSRRFGRAWKRAAQCESDWRGGERAGSGRKGCGDGGMGGGHKAALDSHFMWSADAQKPLSPACEQEALWGGRT